MGFCCAAAGIWCRILDSPWERLLATSLPTAFGVVFCILFTAIARLFC
ncbi:MAG: hypothetical protein VB055_06040 [Oscillospiraceae bacterium]|nr:hypothetical protein [Oscillospiraceae bacterium]